MQRLRRLRGLGLGSPVRHHWNTPVISGADRVFLPTDSPYPAHITFGVFTNKFAVKRHGALRGISNFGGVRKLRFMFTPVQKDSQFDLLGDAGRTTYGYDVRISYLLVSKRPMCLLFILPNRRKNNRITLRYLIRRLPLQTRQTSRRAFLSIRRVVRNRTFSRHSTSRSILGSIPKHCANSSP